MKHQTNRSKRIQDMAFLSMFTAVIFLLAFTPLGLIDLPVIKATILHVPVILGSILMGPKKGAFLGAMFGLSSLIKNTMMPSLSAFVFTPLIPVPGSDMGSPWALFVCFVPRILVGVTPWLVYTLFRRLSRASGVQVISLVLAAVVGALTNTALVMGSIGVLFAGVVLKTGRLRQAMLLHALTNFVGTGLIPLLSGLGEAGNWLLTLLVLAAMFVGLAFLPAMRREFSPAPGWKGLTAGEAWRCFLGSPGMLCFLALFLLLAGSYLV